MDDSKPKMSLEEQALKRRERLKNLSRKREEKHGSNEQTEKEIDSLPTPMFRSYKPANEELNEFVLETSNPGDIAKEVSGLFLFILCWKTF